MEFGPADVDVVHVLVGYGDAFGIEVGVEFAADRQAGVGLVALIKSTMTR